ncbi:MAG: ATP-binding cassette domain-containing protein [Proteobacteria bacterium]|nr:ATP-binding cassette domain-containing protein [Pseudomonadota bacterium]
MALISIQNVSLSFSGPKLLDDVNLQVEPGQRVCLLGRNGEGKSTLMKILSGELIADTGVVATPPGMRVARLEQEVPSDVFGRIFDVVAAGVPHLGETLIQYHAMSRQLEENPEDEDVLARQQDAQHILDTENGWEAHLTVETVLSRLKLDPEAEFSTLSGGMKRRTLLARALASDPDLLLLDEPTNHLDIESITWLEGYLLRKVKTLFFVTHDRMLLRKLATRIIELDRGRLFDWSCDYDTFLTRKQDLLDSEDKQNREFDKKLAREEVWIRQGVKARRTRNEGRVRALKQLRREHSARTERVGAVKMLVQEAAKSGKLVVEAEDVSYGYGETAIIQDFSTAILRGDKVGIIGPNGSGKTTLLKLLLGEANPDCGTLRRGTNLEVAYFDQLRAELDLTKSVRDNVAGGQDVVTIGQTTKHVVGYLKDFLFPSDRIMVPVSVLSGGERNRLLLAKLFTRPSNVLVLDEPTNDLDAETLDLLEERLLEYTGTVLLVSHDRAFLNNVVTSTLALEGNGVVREYVGGYDDWLRQRPDPEGQTVSKPKVCKPKACKAKHQPKGKRKLSYSETQERDQLRAELGALPVRIEALEQAQLKLSTLLADPAFLTRGHKAIAEKATELGALESDLETVLERWETIETRLEELRES